MDRIAALAVANSGGAVWIDIPAEAELDRPVIITLTGTGTDQPVFGHIVITVGAYAKATVVLEHHGSATLRQLGVGCWSATAPRSTFVGLQLLGRRRRARRSGRASEVGRDAQVRTLAATLGGDLVRLVETAEYAGPGGAVEQFGLYFVDAGQHLEHRLFVDHNAPHTKTNVDYRGALQGKGAHSVWVGDVLIRKVAEGITTYESNKNLVLTDGCRADSVPNLEIETGEIAGAGPRLDHRPVRRRAAVLPAQPGHRRGRGPPAGGARLLRRHHPPGRRAGDRGAAAGRRRGRAGRQRRAAGDDP